MANKWHTTQFQGVRCREHPTRKHGAVAKDKYFAIRYQRDGVRKEEGLGWASEGWTAERAAIELAQLKKAHITGDGPSRLKEKRRIIEEKERALEYDALTVDTFYTKTYLPHAKREKKENTWSREDNLYRLWVKPTIGTIPMKQVSQIHLEKIKKTTADAGKAARTIQYAMVIVRMIFNVAKMKGAYVGDSPTSRINMPKVDNGRLRFLTQDEAHRLLDCLKLRDYQAYEMALVSLLSGCRLGEITSLCWQDVDQVNRTMAIRDAKNKTSRVVYLCNEIVDMFKAKRKGLVVKPGDLVFQDNKGRKIQKQPWAFRQAVRDTKLNEGITDRRLKFTFHGLRHTYGSWAAQHGVDVLTIRDMLGQRTLVMATRYAHLSAQAIKAGTDKVAGAFRGIADAGDTTNLSIQNKGG